MFLNIDLSLYYEDILEVIFTAIPMITIGIICLIFSNVSRKKRIKKYNNAVVAKVLKVEEIENDAQDRLLIYLEYIHNGRILTNVYKSFVKYHVGSEIRIILYGDKPGQIISDVPSDAVEDGNAINLHLDYLLSFFGKFFLFSGIIGILTNLMDITEEPIFTKLYIITLYFLVIYVLYGMKKKYNFELDLLHSNKYELIKAKVVGFKPGYKMFHFKPIQFPMIEFNVGGNGVKRLLKEDIIINSGNEEENGTLMVFRNLETGKIFSESDLKGKVEMINTIMVISTVVMIISFLIF